MLITIEELQENGKLLIENREQFTIAQEHWNTNTQNETIEDVTSGEVSKALKTMENGKAAGSGKTTIEFKKNTPREVLVILAYIFTKCIGDGHLPLEWK